MTEFFKNNPIAIRHCVLYVFLQEKSVEKAFDDFCETVGADIIKKEEFQYWFDQFKQGKFDDKEKSISDMREVLRSDGQALRACVMYEWLKSKNLQLELRMDNLCRENKALPVFAKYQNFCKVIGDGVMEYREFEFWFYRFFNGEYDLSFERDEDKKIYELVDMPIDILKNILEYLDTFNRMSLAKTSRTFKEFVEGQKILIKKLEFCINGETALVLFDNYFILIEKKDDDCLRRFGCVKSETTGCLRNERLIQGVSHWKQGIQDFASILKLKNFYLNNLKVDFVSLYSTYYSGVQKIREEIRALEDAFKPTQPLNVKHLTLDAYSMNLLSYILPAFKPGYLSTIDFSVAELEPYHLEQLLFERMGEMEQWKQAKNLTMSKGWLHDSLHHFYHFKKFNVRYRSLSVEDICRMKEIVFKSPEFESCIIYADCSFDTAIRNEFGDAIEGNRNIYHYPIPDSMEMTEYLKNNPTTLRHCVLYVFLQKKSVEEAFNDFCEAVGNDIIKKEDLQSWFDQFKKGKFDDKEKLLADMREVLRNDKQALRACVMYEWLKTKNVQLELMMDKLCRENKALPVFAKYQNFCKVIGDGVLEYREFEFWFYRFFNGEYDLSFERDKDKKFYELVDMPTDTLNNILEYLDTFNRMSLTKTSRSFKEFIEDQKLFIKKLEFRINCETALISFDNHFIFVEKRGDHCIRRSGTGCLRNMKFVQGVSHWEQGIQDFASILKLKKFYLDNLKVDFVSLCLPYSVDMQGSCDAIIALEDAFKSTQQLNVKHFTLDAYSIESLPYILPAFKPGYLSTIDFSVAQSDSYRLEELSFKRMGRMEQWKQAKYLNMSSGWLYGSLHHFYHFKKFNVRFKTLSVEDIRQMKEILFKSSDFESCIIHVDHYFDTAIRNEFGDAIEGNPNIYHYPILDSQEFFKIELDEWDIVITRKQK